MRLFLILLLLAVSFSTLADSATVLEGAPANLRSGKYDTYRVVRVLEPGTQVEVLKQEATYVQAKTAEGDVGWLPMRLIKIAVASPPATPAPVLATVEQKTEIIKAQIEPKQNPNEVNASTWQMLGAGLAGLVLGVLLGMLGVEAYYRKKLNGLRI